MRNRMSGGVRGRRQKPSPTRSVEVFINDGEQVMSAVILTKQEAKGISFFADAAAKLDIVKYDLL